MPASRGHARPIISYLPRATATKHALHCVPAPELVSTFHRSGNFPRQSSSSTPSVRIYGEATVGQPCYERHPSLLRQHAGAAPADAVAIATICVWRCYPCGDATVRPRRCYKDRRRCYKGGTVMLPCTSGGLLCTSGGATVRRRLCFKGLAVMLACASGGATKFRRR